MSDQRFEHEWHEDRPVKGWACHVCWRIADQPYPGECAVKLRAALDAATRERDEARAATTHDVIALRAIERDAIVRWLRSSANAPHPVEFGERALSPSGRGLGLLWADAIERGEHAKEQT